ncbi:MAG: Gfo/Idh/MocA family oxidoreductase [Candidatus Marinimicrobia bacterium]|nr:Gfo/Idh/MocA family oxidoreductase [Candidatus Neomarinimicrobiota bacterium]
MNIQKSRRNFIKKLGAAGTILAGAPAVLRSTKSSSQLLGRPVNNSANDTLQVALIGAGGMGSTDLRTALSHPNTEVVAVADLYQGRLDNAKETFGSQIFTTRDYREILERDDVDVVIIGTHDHWHKQISVDALNKGKHVYCEKPMVHSLEEGPEVIRAQKKSGKIFCVGSQLLSSLGYEKAKELLKDGAIGKLNYAEGVWARRSAGGAWNGPIPADASPETIDWDTFLKDKKRYQFDPERFFNWRKYKDYGTGMNGDLFVHIISGLHFVTDSFGPNQIYSTGGIRFWQDGREVPDVLIGTFDYPETQTHPGFNLSLRCNFVDGTQGSYFYVMRLIGSEGLMEIQPNKVILERNKVLSGIDPNVDPSELKKALNDRKRILGPEEIVYEAEADYKGCHYDHFGYFFDAVRNGSQLVEDAVFGYRAAAPALACNDSYFQKKIIQWDPVKMQKIN